MDKPVVAVTAFACDPNMSSEPGIGWEFLRSIMLAAANEGNVDVVAFMNQRSKIATDLRLEELGVKEHVVTVGVDLPPIFRFLKNPYLTRFEYLVWSRQTRRRLQRLHLTRRVVLARHVTFASELLPTPISALYGKCRTVWGPVGSLGKADAILVEPRHRRWRSQFALQRVRDIVSRVQSRRIARRVDVVLTASSELADVVTRVGTRAMVFPNTMLDDQTTSAIASLRTESHTRRSSNGVEQGRPLVILCVGNLIYIKRFEIAINALSDPALANANLVIIGKPASAREDYLAPIAARLGVSDRVRFMGHLPRSEVVRNMFAADVLFHPSSREGAPGVIAEATAVGLPVVCFAETGASVILDAAGTSGTKIPAHKRLTRAQVARAIAQTAEMPRIHTPVWGHGRYDELERLLLRQALQEHVDG